jgi:hypothetical protein
MLGKKQVFNTVPFFWTRHYNKTIQYVGYSDSQDDIFIQGDVKAGKFLAFYTKGDKVDAISG